jgi:hypothetical protein
MMNISCQPLKVVPGTVSVCVARGRRARFTVRGMMLGVAITAVATLVFIKPEWDRRRFGRIASYHLGQADACFRRAESLDDGDSDQYDQLIDRFKWHSSIGARYARAASYPGMPEPAPPRIIPEVRSNEMRKPGRQESPEDASASTSPDRQGSDQSIQD